MPENRIMGSKTRYVRSYADSENCKKYFFAKNYVAIFALFIGLAVWLLNPLPAHAETGYGCFGLLNHGNRINSVYFGGFNSSTSTLNGRAPSLSLIRDYCRDGGTQYYNNHASSNGANLIATRVVQDTAPDVYWLDFTDYIQSWDMSQVADRLGCSGARGNSLRFPGINQAITLLPQSPEGMRVPTIISRIAGENSLAGNLAIELYSGVWQFLGILTSFKLFKVFFRG